MSGVTLLTVLAVSLLTSFPNFNTFVFCDSETCFKHQVMLLLMFMTEFRWFSQRISYTDTSRLMFDHINNILMLQQLGASTTEQLVNSSQQTDVT